MMDQCIYKNAQLLANNITTDLEVHAVSPARANKSSHMNVVSCPGLLQEIIIQIQTQLKQCLYHEELRRKRKYQVLRKCNNIEDQNNQSKIIIQAERQGDINEEKNQIKTEIKSKDTEDAEKDNTEQQDESVEASDDQPPKKKLRKDDPPLPTTEKINNEAETTKAPTKDSSSTKVTSEMTSSKSNTIELYTASDSQENNPADSSAEVTSTQTPTESNVTAESKAPSTPVVDESAVDSPNNTTIDSADSKNTKSSSTYVSNAPSTMALNNLIKKKRDSLMKVHLRLRENGISILDEFLIDPEITNPITIASALCEDLHIPSENINGIAFSIAEQMLGFKVEEDTSGMLIHKEDDNKVGVDKVQPLQQQSQPSVSGNNWMDKGVKADRSIPSAWKSHEKEEGVALAHYVTSCNLR